MEEARGRLRVERRRLREEGRGRSGAAGEKRRGDSISLKTSDARTKRKNPKTKLRGRQRQRQKKLRVPPCLRSDCPVRLRPLALQSTPRPELLTAYSRFRPSTTSAQLAYLSTRKSRILNASSAARRPANSARKDPQSKKVVEEFVGNRWF